MSPLVKAEGLAIAGRLETSSLELRAGELVGLIGPNGSGKTSLLHALAGIPPSTGNVRIAGQVAKGMHPDRRQRLFTFLPASRDVVWPLKARDLISLALPRGSDWSNVAERLEIGALLDRRMDRLSTGERSRIMIVRALAPDPSVLLLDEPIANLDPLWQLLLLDEFRRLAHDEGKALLVAIHDLRAAVEWSDRLILMSERQIRADAAPSELLGSGLIEQVFGVELGADLSLRQADRQSSP